jgi:hypothetical protein
MHITSDGDLVQCDDCGWDIRESPLPVEIREVKEPPSATPFSKKKSSSRKDKKS